VYRYSRYGNHSCRDSWLGIYYVQAIYEPASCYLFGAPSEQVVTKTVLDEHLVAHVAQHKNAKGQHFRKEHKVLAKNRHMTTRTHTHTSLQFVRCAYDTHERYCVVMTVESTLNNMRRCEDCTAATYARFFLLVSASPSLIFLNLSSHLL